MKYLDGLSQGMMLSGVVFLAFVVVLGFMKHPNITVMTAIFVVIETIITVVGIALGIYSMVKQ